jgi:O-antigen/teichoic acid export membrane protein
MLTKLKSFLFENKTVKQTVAKNTFWLTVSNFGGRIIKAAIVIYGARVLGTQAWGVFSYAASLAAVFTLFSDPGVNAVIMRDTPKSDENGKKAILATTLVLKFFMISLSALIVLFVAPYFSTLPGSKALIPIVMFILTFDTIREFFSSFIRAKEKMEQEAGIYLFTNLAIVVAGFICLSISPTAKSFGWAYVAGTAAGALLALIVLRSYLKNIFSYFSSALIKPILASAWPFAITGALGLLFTNTDIIIISWMRTAADVGIYSAAIRIIQLFYLIPMILQYSTLPVLARLANRDNATFRAALERTIGLVFLASIPLALGGALLGTQIMTLVFGGDYASGGLSFKILMISMLVDYSAIIISGAVFAYNHQKSLIITSAIGGAANVLFDIILIPRYGIAGSAVATLLAQTLSNWYLWHMMKKINYFEVFPRLKKIIVAGVVMACVTLLLKMLGVNVIPNVLISAAIYLLILRITREPLLIEVKRVVLGGVS